MIGASRDSFLGLFLDKYRAFNNIIYRFLTIKTQERRDRMSGNQEGLTLAESFRQIVMAGADKIKGRWPKLNLEDDNFSLFVGRILVGENYFYLRCQLTSKAIEKLDGIKTEYSNGYIQLIPGGILEIAIYDIKKLERFLGSDNDYVEDGSVKLVR
jgi:hypothetical protein